VSQRTGILPRKTKLAFGFCDLGGNLFFSMIGFHLLYYFTDVVGLAPILAGAAFTVGRVWDAVTDPAIGYASDNTRTRWGRRRPYMFVGSILLFILMIVMFTAPGWDNQWWLFAWALIVYLLLNTAYTLVNIPYTSLTPELTSDFQERTNLNGYRFMFAVLGTMLGGAAVHPIVNLAGGPPSGWSAAGAVMGAIMMISALVTVFGVRETAKERVKSQVKVFRSYLQVIKQRPLLTAGGAFAIHMCGVAVVQASLVYYFEYVYRKPDLLFAALLSLLVSSFIFIPIWVVISRRIGKKASYNIGMGILSVVVVLFFLFAPRFGPEFSFVMMALAGTGLATNYVMPWSLIPDAVEWDYAENGFRREGVFYGIWMVMSKLGQALGAGLTGLVLALFNYIQPIDGEAVFPQPDTAELGIRLLVGPMPVVFFILGILTLSKYPITSKVYEEILQRIRAQGAQVPGDEGQVTE